MCLCGHIHLLLDSTLTIQLSQDILCPDKQQMAVEKGEFGFELVFSEKDQFKSKIEGRHQKPKWVQNKPQNRQSCHSSQLFSTAKRFNPKIAPTKSFYTSGMKRVKSFNSLVLNTCAVVKHTITPCLLCSLVCSISNYLP